MNEVVNKFSLAGEKFLSIMHLWQPGFTFNACVIFTNNIGRTRKVKKSGDSRYIYQKELDKACF